MIRRMRVARQVEGHACSRTLLTRKDIDMWFAGIDWADRHHDTVVIDEAGRKVAQLRVEHNPEGLKKEVALLA